MQQQNSRWKCFRSVVQSKQQTRWANKWSVARDNKGSSLLTGIRQKCKKLVKYSTNCRFKAFHNAKFSTIIYYWRTARCISKTHIIKFQFAELNVRIPWMVFDKWRHVEQEILFYSFCHVLSKCKRIFYGSNSNQTPTDVNGSNSICWFLVWPVNTDHMMIFRSEVIIAATISQCIDGIHTRMNITLPLRRCGSTKEIRILQRFSNCSLMHTTASALCAVELIGNILNIFPGSGLYGSAGGSGVTEIGIESCRKARAQFHDGYTVNETGKCANKQVNIILDSASHSY